MNRDQEYKEHFSPDGEKIQHDMDFPEEVMTTPEQLREEFEKTFADTNYRGAVTRDAMSDFWLAKLEEARKEAMEDTIEKMKMEGLEHKLIPFQSTVNTYIKNRGEEILESFHPHSKDEK